MCCALSHPEIHSVLYGRVAAKATVFCMGEWWRKLQEVSKGAGATAPNPGTPRALLSSALPGQEGAVRLAADRPWSVWGGVGVVAVVRKGFGPEVSSGHRWWCVLKDLRVKETEQGGRTPSRYRTPPYARTVPVVLLVVHVLDLVVL